MEYIVEKQLTELYKEIHRWIHRAGNILVFTHVNPDGDAVGSALGLCLYLRKKGKTADAMTPNDFPDFLKWLPGSAGLVRFQGHRQEARSLIGKADLIIMLDFNDRRRMGYAKDSIMASEAPKVLIDHHPGPDQIAGLVLTDTMTSSTAEMVYNLISLKGDNALIDKDIASCLFAGIMTDTGCFSFNSSCPSTYMAVSALLAAGIDKDGIYDKIYNQFSPDRIRLLGYCLHRKMTVLPGLHTAYITLSLKEQEEFRFVTGDSEGFVNYPLSIAGIIFSVLIIEKKEHVKLSFRSKGAFSVNDFAGRHFNGGGHDNAAGGESYDSLEKTVNQLKEILPGYADALKTAFNT